MVALAALCSGFAPASAEDAVSSLEDRERFVSIIRQLEQDPLNPDFIADRRWAIDWLAEAPDITVVLCADTLGDLLQSDYRHEPEIVVHYMFAIGVQIIENPQMNDEPVAQQLAGVEGALTTYRSILRSEPEAKSRALEEIILIRDRGEMAEFVREAYSHCTDKE